MKKHKFILPLCTTLLISSLPLSAAITWQVATDITGLETDISTTGTSEYAYAFNEADTTVNGVEFLAGGATNGSADNFGNGDAATTGLINFNGGAFTGGNATPWATAAASYRALLDGGIFQCSPDSHSWQSDCGQYL